MTRAEFVKAYTDLQRKRRGLVPAVAEAAAHTQDKEAAGELWRRQKQRLQTQPVERWLAREEKKPL